MTSISLDMQETMLVFTVYKTDDVNIMIDEVIFKYIYNVHQAALSVGAIGSDMGHI